jgi:prophage regulatory protein
MENLESKTKHMIRIQNVIALTGMSRQSIYAYAAAGKFPKPVKLGERCSAWIEEEVTNWIDSKIKASRA